MKKFERKKIRGFTLLEMLLVMGIIGVMSTVVLAINLDAKKQEVLKNSAREVASITREAQHYALTGARMDNTHFPCQYQVEKSGNGLKISYKYHLGDTLCSDVANLHSQDYYTFPIDSSVTVEHFNPIIFTVPHGTTNIAAGENVRRITLTSGSDTFSVCVYRSSNIKEVKGSSCD